MLAPEPRFDPLKRMQNFFDLDGRSCNVCGTTQTAGIAVDWALGLLFADMSDTPEQYRAIEKSLEDVPIGSEGVMFLPYLMGERTPHWDAAARGVFVGLSLAGNRKTLLRAVYEGVSFAIAEIVEVYADLAMPIKTFTLLGGGIRSPFWRTLICDIAGIPMRVHPFPTHAISLGAAMAAGVSVGLWKDLGEAVAQIRGFELLEPDLENTGQYKRFFSVYKGLYRNLKPVFDGLKLAGNPS
jgi:xylulokinase